VLPEDSAHSTSQKNSVPYQPSERRDIPSGRPTVQSIFHPDLCLCQEASNCSNLNPSKQFSSTSGRHSVFDQLWDFLPKHIVSSLDSFCVWTKSLMCKDAVNRDSTCQSIFKRLCTVKKIEDFRFPVSHPDDVLSRPDAHLSTIPSVRTTCHPVWTLERPASSVRTKYLSFRPLHCIEKLLFQLASVRTSQQPVRTPNSDRQISDSFQVQIWED
jgi:hypothetical protein